MKKLLLCAVGIFLLVASTSAQTIQGTYAIQNTITGKNLRPYEAGGQNGNRIVLYDHVEWKCMTWNFIAAGDNCYQLKNLYTSKSFQPKELPTRSGSQLEQQPLSNSAIQLWEFVLAADKNYYIRLKGTDLYITASSSQTNSSILLQPKQDNALQVWKLVAQNPSM